MLKCPSDFQIAALLDNALSPDEAREIREHAAECGHCSELILELLELQDRDSLGNLPATQSKDSQRAQEIFGRENKKIHSPLPFNPGEAFFHFTPSSLEMAAKGKDFSLNLLPGQRGRQETTELPVQEGVYLPASLRLVLDTPTGPEACTPLDIRLIIDDPGGLFSLGEREPLVFMIKGIPGHPAASLTVKRRGARVGGTLRLPIEPAELDNTVEFLETGDVKISF